MISDFNQQCIAELKRSGFVDRVAVVGSGPSCPFITPIEKLAARLSAACHVRMKREEAHCAFFERAHDKDSRQYFKIIRQSFGESPEWDARAYRHLAAIDFKSLITLNHDDQLPTAFKRRHESEFQDLFSVFPTPPGGRFVQPGDLVGHKPRLVAIHGYRNEQDTGWYRKLILRVSDYNRHYGDGQQANRSFAAPQLLYWWGNLLTSQPCVFVGTSLKEPGLYRVVEELLKDGNPALEKQDHIHLLHAEKTSTAPVPGKSLNAIRQIFYDRENQEFTGLLDVLSAFSNLPTDRPVPKVPKLTPITIRDKLPF